VATRNNAEIDIISTLRELSNFWKLADKKEYDEDEPRDYERWTKTLRAIGRVMSPHWPDFGDHANEMKPEFNRRGHTSERQLLR
jgi:hypothetical protein